MDPEQIYQEVLSEEQGKGSPTAVAEGRAKAARQRAVHGSPHPKEPRWWPGAQPHFEGGDGAAPAPAQEAAPEPEPEPEPEPAPADEAPAEEAPAAEAPAATPPDIGDAAQSERPDAPAPAPAAGTPTTAPEPAAAPAVAATATQVRPAGVTHGTDSGNRLRPEDAVGTDAQFDAQKAMADRRRLIDELVSTGVPAATAQEAGQPKAPLLLLAYLLIPLIAIGLLAAADDAESDAGGGDGPPPVEQPGGPTESIVAEGTAFNLDEIVLVAGEQTTIEFENKDSGTDHNVAIYETDTPSDENVIFDGDLVTGPGSATYEFKAPPPGDYYFQCDVHPDMKGTVTSEKASGKASE